MHKCDASRRILLGSILLLLADTGAAPDSTARDPQTSPPLAIRSRFYPADPAAPKTRRKLEEAVSHVMSLSESEMLALVPDRAGLRHVGCPRCSEGKSQRNAFDWDPRKPDRLECKACDGGFPDPAFPTDGVTKVATPSGRSLEYRYWKGDEDLDFYFPAHIDWQKRVYMRDRCIDLAVLYHLGGDRRYARRAALILNRFAESFPDYVYHYDYPDRNPRFFDGNVPPSAFLRGYRTARWTDWAYQDIPTGLIFAFELIRDSGELERIPGARKRIVDDFFLSATRQVAANPETYTNMSPAVWEGMTAAGLVLESGEYLEEIADRLDTFTREQFFYDGMWKEGTFSYQSQALLGINRVLGLISDNERIENISNSTSETLARIEARARVSTSAFNALRLPTGHSPPVHDTWPNTRGPAIQQSKPHLLGGVGHALLAHGDGTRQVQAHLTWSGGYGHHHYDALSLIFFARGAELYSDIGYTHTRQSGWTKATASHNTVVVDLENQIDGFDSASPGRLLRLDTGHPRVQLVAAANPLAYRETVERYERMLALIDTGPEPSYLIDVFHVVGGKQHDYLLHGSAEVKQDCSVDGQAACKRGGKAASLAPGKWEKPSSEADRFDIEERGNAYGFFNVSARRPIEAASIESVRFDAPTARSITHLIVEVGDELITGVSPQVRPAKEREKDLDAHTRTFLMLRRQSGEAGSRFVSVIQAAGKAQPDTYTVTRLPATGSGIALLISGKYFSDLIAIDAKDLRAEYDDRSLRADGDLTVARLSTGDWFLYTTGRASYGELTAKAPARSSSRLLRAEQRGGGGYFVLEPAAADLIPTKGAILLLEHGDGATHGYTIENARQASDTLEVWTREPPGFQLSNQNAGVHFVSFPHTNHPGPTRAIWQPPGSARGRP